MSDDAAFPKQREKAFDLATDTVKQLLTLSTGIIALTITFSKDFLGLSPGAGLDVPARWVISIAWVLYLGSIGFGVWAFMALTGELQPDQDLKRLPSIRETNVTFPVFMQILTFFVATIFIVIFGAMTIW